MLSKIFQKFDFSSKTLFMLEVLFKNTTKRTLSVLANSVSHILSTISLMRWIDVSKDVLGFFLYA